VVEKKYDGINFPTGCRTSFAFINYDLTSVMPTYSAQTFLSAAFQLSQGPVTNFLFAYASRKRRRNFT
jgi:hypothetical protein